MLKKLAQYSDLRLGKILGEITYFQKNYQKFCPYVEKNSANNFFNDKILANLLTLVAKRFHDDDDSEGGHSCHRGEDFCPNFLSEFFCPKNDKKGEYDPCM
jgi:hypothetical protein